MCDARDTTTNKGQEKSELISPLFYEIESLLGDISDFEIINRGNHVEIKYKSNGVEKSIFNTDTSNKILIQCYLYCMSHFSNSPVI